MELTLACERLPHLQERLGGSEKWMQVNAAKQIGKKPYFNEFSKMFQLTNYDYITCTYINKTMNINYLQVLQNFLAEIFLCRRKIMLNNFNSIIFILN